MSQRVDPVAELASVIKAAEGLAIDPGDTHSGWVAYTRDEDELGYLKLHGYGKDKNSKLRKAMHKAVKGLRKTHLAIETPRPSGMPVGAETMETMVQIGRFLQMWPGPWTYVFRPDVKIYVCGAVNAKDSNVRQSLIDRFGGDSIALGGKKCEKCKGKGWFGAGRPTCPECEGSCWEIPPGPLAEMARDAWAALGVAVYAAEYRPSRHVIAGVQSKRKKRAKRNGGPAKRRAAGKAK